MNKLLLLLWLASLIYVGNWNGEPVYVNPDDISGLQAIMDLGFSGTEIKLKMGNTVYSNWHPQQILNVLNSVQNKGGK